MRERDAVQFSEAGEMLLGTVKSMVETWGFVEDSVYVFFFFNYFKYFFKYF